MANCSNCGKEKKNSRNPRCNSCAQKERFTRMQVWNAGLTKEIDSRMNYERPTKWVKKDSRITGKNAYQWKEKDFTMTALHNWVKKQLGKPLKCDFCGTIDGEFQWANKSQFYKRELSDWLRLCISCHKLYDFVCRKSFKYNYLLFKGGSICQSIAS